MLNMWLNVKNTVLVQFKTGLDLYDTLLLCVVGAGISPDI